MTQRKQNKKVYNGQELFGDQQVLKGMIELMVRQVLEEQIEEHLRVRPYERSDKRQGHRNGYKPRTMNTRIGKLEFEVPQVREGGWFPQVFERYQRSEKSLLCAMREMVVMGVSTRKVSNVLNEMAGFELSASTVSNAMVDLDAEIKKFRHRSLSEHSYPYLVIDARYEHIRKQGHTVNEAVLIVAGINEQGGREVLGFSVGDSESEITWGDLFKNLKSRGLHGVELIVSDAHGGIKKAMSKHFQGVLWQRCRVHFHRELLNRASYKDRRELSHDIRAIFAIENKRHCLIVAEEVSEKWKKRYPIISKLIAETTEDCLTIKSFPGLHQLRLSSTNMLERLMRTLKSRTRVVSIFPNESSCERYIGALLIETHEAWLEESLYSQYVKMPVEKEVTAYQAYA